MRNLVLSFLVTAFFVSFASAQTPGNTLEFDGYNDEVIIADHTDLDPGNEITIEAWVLMNETNGQHLISKADYGSGFYMGLMVNRLYVRVWNGNSYSPMGGFVPIGQWTHLAFTYKTGDKIFGYINGEKVIETVVSNDPIVTNALDLLFGNSALSGNHLNGWMDEVRIWNYAKTQAEIIAAKDDVIDPATAGLIAYYRFDENNTTTLPDLTGNAHNGTLTNMTASSDWVPSMAMVKATAVGATDIIANSFTANWDAPVFGPGIGIYYVDVDDNSDFSSPVYENVNCGTQMYHNFSDLNYLTTYYYRVRAYSYSADGISQNSNTMSVTTKAVPPPGYALDFDGANDYVYLPHNLLLKPASEITFEAWVKADDITTNQYYEIYRKEDGADRHLLAFQEYGTVLAFGINVGGTYEELDANITSIDFIDKWHHVAATYDGSYKRVYIDGVVIDSVAVSGAIATTGTLPAYIGSFGGGAEHFNGEIDEFRLWGTARSTAEISASMNDTISPAESGLIVYYRFDSKSGNTVYDLTANLINGTLNNMDTTLAWMESYALIKPQADAISDISGAQLNANWTAPSFGGIPTTYYIDIDDNADFSSPVYEDLETGDVLSYTVTDLAYQTTYYLRVRAEKDNLGQTMSSNVVSAATTAEMLPPGFALDFDGSNDHVLIPHSAENNITGSITLEAWVYIPADFTGYQGIIDKSATTSYGLQLGSIFDQNAVGFYLGSSTPRLQTTANALHSGQWQHVAATFNDATDELYIYVNGEVVESGSFAGTWAGNTSDISIGAVNQGGANFFEGRIDEVRIWNIARSQSEIRSTMNDTIPASSVGLVSYYRFDHLSGTTLEDLAGTNDGTLTDMDASDWVESYALLHPVNTSITDVIETSCDINWEAPLFGGTPTQYFIDIDDNSDFTSLIINSLNVGNTLSYHFDPLTPGKYYFRIRAEKNSLGQSFASSVDSVFIPDFSRPGYCLTLEGHPTAVRVPYSAELNPLSFTYELWIKPDQNYGNPMGTYNNDDKGFYFSVNGASSFGFYFGNGNYYSSNISYDLGKFHWTHLAATRDDNTDTVKFYINGVLKTARTGVFVPNDFQDMIIGGDNYYSFKGNIDEVRIWDYPRTAAQINGAMNDTVDPGSAGLLAYYRFDQDLSETVVDLSGNHHGELYQYIDPAEAWVESYALLRPVALSQSGETGHSFTLDWSPPEFGIPPTSYYLYVDDDIDFSDPVLASYNIGLSASYEVTGLIPNTTYYFKVCAYGNDTTEWSQATPVDSVRTTGVPNPGYALSFNGVDEYISTPNILSTSFTTFTTEMWINPETISDTMALFVNGDNGHAHLFVLPDSTLLFEVKLSDWLWYAVISDRKVIPGRWQHIAAVWQRNSALTLYLDGVETGVSAVPDMQLHDPSNGYYTSLGAMGAYSVYNHYFSGKMDEVRIWQAARSQAQLLAGMNDTIYRNTTGLLAYYRFDQQNCGTLYDWSDFGGYWDERDGVLKNMDTVSAWVESYALLTPQAESATQITSSGFTANWQPPTLGGTPSTYYIDVDDDIDFSSPLPGYNNHNTGDVLSFDITGLDPIPTYYFRVRAYKDGVSGQCQHSDTIAVMLIDSLSIEITSFSNATCAAIADGSATVTPQQGTSPYTYEWTGGQTDSSAINLAVGTHCVTVTDATGDTAVACVEITFTPVIYTNESIICFGDSTWLENAWQTTAGTYTDTLPGATGCDSIVETTLLINPDIFISDVIITNETCGDTNATALPVYSGGYGNYSFDWSNDGTGDADDSELLDSVNAGTYSFTVFDQLGCQADTTVSIENLAGPAIDSMVVSEISCYGADNGAISVYFTESDPPAAPYSIEWSTMETGATITDLPAGAYNVTVADTNGCNDFHSVILDEPDSINAWIEVYPPDCYLGTGYLECVPLVDSIEYSYSWSTGDTNAVVIIQLNSLYEYLNGTVTISDPLGCSAILSYNDTMWSPDSLGLLYTVVDDTNSTGVGAIDIGVFGGTPPYSYSWNTTDTVEDINNLPPGYYSVVVTDSNNCLVSEDSILVDIIIVSIESSGELGFIKIYPNPNNGLFQIVADNSLGEIVIELADITGNILETYTMNSETDFRKEINLTAYAKGVYYLRIESNHKIITKKIIYQ
ncbi:MAG: fibronectin type III domain-containing protein [Bacteroidetes bacterium]|nr:fibronectin type III domain-containing protein [Bacteroidota bacterium]MBU1717894.1 fibronectin type III domain-containing protein [Bacteroidota bacterium]